MIKLNSPTSVLSETFQRFINVTDSHRLEVGCGCFECSRDRCSCSLFIALACACDSSFIRRTAGEKIGGVRFQWTSTHFKLDLGSNSLEKGVSLVGK